MTLPAPKPMPRGLLADVLDMWQSQNWDPAALHRFRMGPEDDQAVLDALSPDELDALQDLSDEDVAALNKLTPEQRAALADSTGEVDETDLPEKVKAILTKERTAAREASKAKRASDKSARTEKERADRAEAELAKLKKKKPDDVDKVDPDEVIENARREAEDTATKRSNRVILEARIEAQASGKFASPALAARLLDLDDFEVGKDGKVDRKAIDEALDELLEENPGLSATRRTRPKPVKQGKHGNTGTGADAGRAEAERRYGTKNKQQ
ncbi:MAG: hypothetical protein JWN67_5029 [Actinomycetia bacterium]|nr:hypothetical protein [Actinomycetes bacterium]